MKSVHIIGLGLVAGAVALGAMISVMTLRWETEAFPASGPVVAAAAGPAGVASSVPPSADAAKVKALFDTKCGGCHTIGGGKGLGPDLNGVATRRSHDWIVEFITSPDQVIARGDAAATQMVKDYGVPMPNVGISKPDAETLTTYISR